MWKYRVSNDVKRRRRYKFDDELSLFRSVKDLIRHGRLRLAEQEAQKVSEPRRSELMKMLISAYRTKSMECKDIAEVAKYRKEEKRILYARIKENPQGEETIDNIKRLINLARAEQDIDEEGALLKNLLEIDPLNYEAIKQLINIDRFNARIMHTKGNVDMEKSYIKDMEKWLNRAAEIKPENIGIIEKLIEISRVEKDKDNEMKYLRMKLNLAPDDVNTMLRIAKLLRRDGKLDEQKDLLNRALIFANSSTKPSILNSLARIARIEKDYEEERRLLRESFIINQKNKEVWELLEANRQGQYNEEKKKKSKLKAKEDVGQREDKANSVREKNIEPQLVRNLIYESEDILENIEKIKEMLENQDATDREVILSEVFSYAKLPQRAIQSLKNYKKGLDNQTQESDIKIINQTIELAKRTNILKEQHKIKWDELWEKIEKIRVRSMMMDVLRDPEER